MIDRLLSAFRTRCRNRGAAVAAFGTGMIIAGASMAVYSIASAQQPYPAPYPAPNAGPPPNYDQAYPRQDGSQASSRDLRCAQLEHELANAWVVQRQGTDDRQNVEAEIRKYDKIFQQSQARAERQGCYRSNFIFGRSLVRTPKCLRLERQIENARRQLEALNAQRQARSGGSNRRRDELVAALARAGCGRQYERQARGGSGGGGIFNWLEEGFWDTRPREGLSTSRIEQFATYRTLCVRQCDGYYFPVSFSTLPSNFPADTQKCQSQCAAPAELYVYRNPGEEAEQMVSSDGSRAYANLPNAWRYRKQFVKGCSCKADEYDPAEIAAANEKAETEALAKQGDAAVPPGDGSQFADDKNKPSQTQ